MLHTPCGQCALPQLTCICALIQPISTQARFVMLSAAKEFERPSNTGRLLKLLNPDATTIIGWERKRPSAELLQILQTQPEAYLVFPASSDSQTSRLVSQVRGPAPLFILLDGTWQEARKIQRKSDYLDALPLLALPEDLQSAYPLRARQRKGSLCTIEAASECLKLAADPANAQALLQGFELFKKHYQAGLSGHAVKG